MSAPTVRGPREIPDLRLWLAEQWEPGRVFSRGTRLRSMSPDALLTPTGTRPTEAQSAAFAQWEYRTLLDAELWWVAPPMVDLIDAAVPMIPDDATPADLPIPSRCGFVVFGSPIIGTDASSGEEILVDAVAWNATTRLPPLPGSTWRMALGISSYRWVNFDDDETLEGMVETVAGEEFGTEAMVVNGYAARRMVSMHGSTWVPLGRSDWPVHEHLESSPWEMDEHVRASFIEDRRLMAALFTLLAQQGVTSRTIEKPERAAIRRHKRAGVDPNLADVQVVELRRPRYVQGDKPEGDGVAWSKRWLVGGHMRWQACGEGRKDRKLIFIAPYIKGPDDKPFVAPQRVNSWVR